jgi:hypothetical protein
LYKYFLSATAPCTSKQAAHIPLSVNMPNGTSIQLSHTCDLLLTEFSPQARKSNILPGLVHNSLIYVGQLCDNSRDVTFNRETVSVMNNGKCAMIGSRNPHLGLWRVNLKNAKTAIQSTCNHAHDTSKVLPPEKLDMNVSKGSIKKIICMLTSSTPLS